MGMKVFSTVLKPVFLVLIKCLALSTPGSMSCEGGAGEMGKKTVPDLALGV